MSYQLSGVTRAIPAAHTSTFLGTNDACLGTRKRKVIKSDDDKGKDMLTSMGY